RAHRRLEPGRLFHARGQAAGQGNAPRAHADEDGVAEVRMALQDLVGRAREPVRVHQLLALAVGRRGHQLTFPPSGTGRSGIKSTFSPLPFSTARTSTSDSSPATRRGGRFTTAITCSPTSSDGS